MLSGAPLGTPNGTGRRLALFDQPRVARRVRLDFLRAAALRRVADLRRGFFAVFALDAGVAPLPTADGTCSATKSRSAASPMRE